MGSDPAHDKDVWEEEQPQHLVSLPAYQMGRYLVTVAEYACFVRAAHGQPERWQQQLGRLDHPVVNVSSRAAVAYATWLAQLTGETWRLPTEAEWERAARGTDGRIYPWGDTFDRNRCNTSDGGPGATTPVGAYADRGDASPCGAHDMAGNVWEWTSSLYRPYPYNPDDGREGPNTSSRSQWSEDDGRVLRGGAWRFASPRSARAACRISYDGGTDMFEDLIGFRMVREFPGY
jgi:formylglycine-generating enzyme required for sulfatase activity